MRNAEGGLSEAKPTRSQTEAPTAWASRATPNNIQRPEQALSPPWGVNLLRLGKQQRCADPGWPMLGPLAHRVAPLPVSLRRCAPRGSGAPESRSCGRAIGHTWRVCETRLRTLARRPRAPCDRGTRLAALHCGASDSIDPLVAGVARVRVTSPPAGAAPASALWLVSRKTPQIEAGRLTLEQNRNKVKKMEVYSPRRLLCPAARRAAHAVTPRPQQPALHADPNSVWKRSCEESRRPRGT